VKVSKTPKQSFSGIDSAVVATLIATISDIALIVDGNGVIQDVTCQRDEMAKTLQGFDRFVGKAWVDTVIPDSRSTVEALLAEATTQKASRWSELKYPSSRGGAVSILYATVRTESKGGCVAVGRDVQAFAALQQRLIEAQISLERDYSRFRHVEARYRILFQMLPEPALMVDGTTETIVEANQAALQQTGAVTRNLIGRPLSDIFHRDCAAPIQSLLSKARATNYAESVKARLKHDKRDRDVSALHLRQDAGAIFLVRFGFSTEASKEIGLSDYERMLLICIEQSPDGLVVTDVRGRVILANPAFIDMAQLASEEQARGTSLERWVGRPGIDFNILMASLRGHGRVRLFATILQGELGATPDIEISASFVEDASQPIVIFAIRNVERRVSAISSNDRQLPRSAEQLTELIGRVPLKDILRETTDVIEKLCIKAALQVTDENRASAAEMLGLSRQSLYVKLRRFGLEDLQDTSGSER